MKATAILTASFFLYFWFIALNFAAINYIAGQPTYCKALEFILSDTWMWVIVILAIVAGIATAHGMTKDDI